MFRPRWWTRIHWQYVVEWALIIVVAYFYTAAVLLDFDPHQLQQTGEQNESATLPVLIQQSLVRHHELPLWDHYLLTGLPLAGDPLSHIWNPVSTIPILIWGAINGLKVSIFISFFVAGLGQWLFSQVFGVRSILRLWSALLFMLSGGLGLLWHLGWYELLLGMAWFPWCFAALWWALPRRDYASLIGVTLCIALVLSAGGGYYVFYLGVSLAVLVAVALCAAPANTRRGLLKRTALIVGLSFGLLGVMLIPVLAAYPYISKQAGPETAQFFSQPVPYALLNYIVSDPRWHVFELLGAGVTWTWFYIGWLPFVGVALASATFVQARWRRWSLAAVAVLTLVILAWHANRFTPVSYVYDLLPFLYQLRFPNRLLILAASPLIVVGGLGLQQLLLWMRQLARKLAHPAQTIWLRRLLDGLFILGLAVSLYDVFTVNQVFSFERGQPNPQAPEILNWLKAYDPSLYYINVGGSVVYWDWTAAAFEAEMPMINFEYGRYVTPTPQTYELNAPVFAKPRYMILIGGLDTTPALQLVRDFGQFKVWRVPDALPFAFLAAPQKLVPNPTLTPEAVSEASVHFDGPNRIVVQANAQSAQRLVVLVSNFPGWRLEVDGQAGEIKPISGYLSADALPGQHTYTFIYQPVSPIIGLIVTILTLFIMDGLLWLDARQHFVRAASAAPPQPYAKLVSYRSHMAESLPMLTPNHLITLRSLLNRIIPADDYPDAWDTGVGDYLLRQFNGDLKDSLPLYLAGLDALDAEALAQANAKFAALPPDSQDALLKRVEAGDVKTAWATDPMQFFKTVIEHATEGFYSDPGNGGNRNGVSWRMIGFTGDDTWSANQ